MQPFGASVPRRQGAGTRGAAGLGDERRAPHEPARWPGAGRRARLDRRPQRQVGGAGHVRADPSDNYFQETAYRLLSVDDRPGPGRGTSLGPVALNTEILHPAPGANVAAGRDARSAATRSPATTGTSSGSTCRSTAARPGRRPTSGTTRARGPGGCGGSTSTCPLGPTRILARAWDSTGATQPSSPADVWNPKGYVNNSWADVTVTAGPAWTRWTRRRTGRRGTAQRPARRPGRRRPRRPRLLQPRRGRVGGVRRPRRARASPQHRRGAGRGARLRGDRHRPGHPRRRHRPVRRRQRRRRLRRAVHREDDRDHRDQRRRTARGRPARRRQRPPAGGRAPSTACGTRPTRPAPRGRRSAATSPPTPAACAA